MVLAIVIAVGYHVGQTGSTPLTVHEPRLADERPAVAEMLTRVSQIKVVTTVPATGLNEWAEETADYALENAKRRASAAGETDPIALAYAAIALNAQDLSVVSEEDAPAVLTLAAKMGINYDRLAAAAGGLDVPGLPDAPTRVVIPDANSATATDVIIETNEGTK